MMSLSRILGVAGLVGILLVPPAMAETLDPQVEADAQRGYAEMVTDNLMVAMEYLQKAAEKGHVRSQVRLGYLLDQSEENEAALYWYQKAVEKKDPEGMVLLSRLYQGGEGVEKDEAKALKLLQEAAEQRFPYAMRGLAEAHKGGLLGLQADAQRALELYLAAAEAGDNVAMQELVNTYERGLLGQAPSPEKVAFWREQLKQVNLRREQERQAALKAVGDALKGIRTLPAGKAGG